MPSVRSFSERTSETTLLCSELLLDPVLGTDFGLVIGVPFARFRIIWARKTVKIALSNAGSLNSKAYVSTPERASTFPSAVHEYRGGTDPVALSYPLH